MIHRKGWRAHPARAVVVAEVRGIPRRKRGEKNQAVGRSRGGRNTKIHALADAKGRLIAILLTGGEAHDCPIAERLFRRVKSPQRLLGDKAYDSTELREELGQRRIHLVIPNPPSSKPCALPHSQSLGLCSTLRNEVAKIMRLIGGFVFICALVVFWHIIAEVRDWWRSMREMERLEKEIDAENANAEGHAHYQALLDNARKFCVGLPTQRRNPG
jgi:transposase